MSEKPLGTALPLRWELTAVYWHQVGKLLDLGWEPFAVVQREPNSPTTTTQVTVYLRRVKPDA